VQVRRTIREVRVVSAGKGGAVLRGENLESRVVAVVHGVRASQRSEVSIPNDAGTVLATVARAAVDAQRLALVEVEPISAVSNVVESTAHALGAPVALVASDILDRTLADPMLVQLAPDLALQSAACLVGGATFAEAVTIWRHDVVHGLHLLAETSDGASARACGQARAALADPERIADEPGYVTAVVSCRGVAGGAVVVELPTDDDPERVGALVARAAERLAQLLERYALLEQDAARERALVEASERRLARLGYDLHDGPMQALVALGAEFRLLSSDVERLISGAAVAAVREGFGSLMEKLRVVEAGLRAVARSSESSGVVTEPLVRAIGRELDLVAALAPIVVHRDLEEEPAGLSDSQRIAIYRVVQEALANVRQHSGATEVQVSFRVVGGRAALRITDNGRGFDPVEDSAAARGRGRLGLVGISERVRLLGGALHVMSRPGSGTTLELALTPWAGTVPGDAA